MNLGMDSLNLGDDPTDGEVDISSEGLVRDAAEDAVANGKKDTNGNAIGVSGEGAPAGSAAKTKGRRSARGDGTNTGAKVVSRGARGSPIREEMRPIPREGKIDEPAPRGRSEGIALGR